VRGYRKGFKLGVLLRFMNKKEVTQEDILKEYFIKHAKRDVPHYQSVPWCIREYKKRAGKVFADPDRGIRKLHQNGFLIKVSKGVYRYDPDFIKNRYLEDFDKNTKEKIFKRDDYGCVICGKGRKEGAEIHADHILPKDKGGKATVENGQTLCSKHNFLKKNFNQTEFAKRIFIKMYHKAKDRKDTDMKKFVLEVLKLFEEYGVDDHIEWRE